MQVNFTLQQKKKKLSNLSFWTLLKPQSNMNKTVFLNPCAKEKKYNQTKAAGCPAQKNTLSITAVVDDC